MAINLNLIGWEKYIKSIWFFMLILYLVVNRLEDLNSIYDSIIEVHTEKDNQESSEIINWNDLRILVAKNRIENFFPIVENYILEYYQSNIINKFILLQAAYSRLKEQESKNILSSENLEIKRNRINERILLLIDELSEFTKSR